MSSYTMTLTTVKNDGEEMELLSSARNKHWGEAGKG
jgi:hypothetical protein